MTTTRPGVLNVRAKTSAVVDLHRDDARPGKPLYLLIPGGLIALAAIGLIIYIGYTTWYKGDMPSSQGLGLIALLAPFYIGGVFLFSYGYELYDMKKTLKLTAIVVFITVSFVVIIAVLFALAGLSGKGSSSKSSSSLIHPSVLSRFTQLPAVCLFIYHQGEGFGQPAWEEHQLLQFIPPIFLLFSDITANNKDRCWNFLAF